MQHNEKAHWKLAQALGIWNQRVHQLGGHELMKAGPEACRSFGKLSLWKLNAKACRSFVTLRAACAYECWAVQAQKQDATIARPHLRSTRFLLPPLNKGLELGCASIASSSPVSSPAAQEDTIQLAFAPTALARLTGLCAAGACARASQWRTGQSMAQGPD